MKTIWKCFSIEIVIVYKNAYIAVIGIQLLFLKILIQTLFSWILDTNIINKLTKWLQWNMDKYGLIPEYHRSLPTIIIKQ